jgi:hypothetical protein
MIDNDNLKFIVQLDLENEAMRDADEVARILGTVAQQVRAYAGDTQLDALPTLHKGVKDLNGNTVGYWDIGF